MEKNKKIFMWIGIGVIAIIAYNKLFKKQEEPFILAQEGGGQIAQTRPMEKV
jgi:uncharacterized membrane protein